MATNSEDCVRRGRAGSQHLTPKRARTNAARIRESSKSLSRSQGFSRFASHTVPMTNHNWNAISKPLKSRRSRVRFCSALAVVLALVVSGTGLVVGASVASASSKTTAKASTKKFDSCLKKHGVKVPTIGQGKPPKGGVPSGTFPSGGGAPGGFKGGSKFQKALKACSKFLPAGSRFGGGPGASSTASTALAAFRNCMTLKHVTLAKGAYGNTKNSSSVTAPSSSIYKKAYSACSALLPKPIPKSG